MKPKVVKHLSNIEIDEISLVDRGANQHATVAIAKRAPEEENMPELFNEDGELLDENQLEDGQIVYDQEGTAYQFTADEVEDEVEVDDREPELAKALNLGGARKVGNAFTSGAAGVGQGAGKATGAQGAAFRMGAGLNRNKKPLAFAGAGTAAGAAGAAGYKDRMKKSYSEQVMEELSKAYTDEERDQVLSKAFAEVEGYQKQAQEAVTIAKAERDLRLTNEYIAKAAEYNVPVDANELGPVLYRMTEQMSYEDCSVIAKCLEAAGSMIFEEVGYLGGGDNVDVLDQVEAQAQELVGKAAGTSTEDAWSAVFEQNPAAYDEYLAQSRRGF